MHKTLTRPKTRTLRNAYSAKRNGTANHGTQTYLAPLTPKGIARFAKRKPIRTLGIGLGSLALAMVGLLVWKKNARKNIWKNF